jgi:hypothetical protein
MHLFCVVFPIFSVFMFIIYFFVYLLFVCVLTRWASFRKGWPTLEDPQRGKFWYINGRFRSLSTLYADHEK